MRTKWIASPLVAAVLLVALAGCGDKAKDSGVASLKKHPESAASPSASPADAADGPLKFAQCMRDNGVPDFPDPEVDANGQMKPPPASLTQGRSDAELKTLQESSQKCASQMGGGKSMPPGDQSKIQDVLVKYAQCMRDHGYDMPDPEMSGQGFRMQSKRDDPVWVRANEACEGDLKKMLGGAGGGS